MWTKKGLSATFLAISLCYFCTEQNKPEHIVLNLEEVAHPHTALSSIKACVDQCLQEWKIPKEKILTIITDNGSNMVAAFKQITAEEETSSGSDSPVVEIDSVSDSETDDVLR